MNDLKVMGYLAYKESTYFSFITDMLMDERIKKEIRKEYVDKLDLLIKSNKEISKELTI